MVCTRFQALVMEPSVFPFAERHGNLEAIYRKLGEKRDTTDVTDVLKELHDLWRSLPRPPFSEQDAESLAERIYEHVWQRSESGGFAQDASAA